MSLTHTRKKISKRKELCREYEESCNLFTYNSISNKLLPDRKKGAVMQVIYFDMDGTIADLYGYDNWLELLRAEDTTPYEDCKVIFDVEELRAVFNALIAAGFMLGVISWGAMGGSREYCKRTRRAKKAWPQSEGNLGGACFFPTFVAKIVS